MRQTRSRTKAQSLPEDVPQLEVCIPDYPKSIPIIHSKKIQTITTKATTTKNAIEILLPQLNNS